MNQDGTKALLDRLDGALAALEGAAARIAGSERTRADLIESLAVMDDDRQRLADDLDAALARTRTLEVAGDAARATLDRACERLSALIDGGEAP
jgi:hypothetical protein